MADTNVRIIVDAIDNATNVLKNLGNNIEKALGKQTQANVSGISGVVNTVTGSFGKLALGLAAAGVVAGAFVVGIQKIGGAIGPLIEASATLERSMLGLAQVAGAFSVNTNDANTAAKELAADGLMTIQESAEGLKNLLATGFSLPEAINLMNTFKDASAANRQGTLGFGEAIIGATIGIKNQNSILVDNVGISKNLSMILKEQGLSVNDLQLVTSNAAVRQKLYNGLLKEGAIFSGAAADTANTLSGNLSQLSTAGFNLKAALGDALSPAVSMLAGQLTGVLATATKWVSNGMVSLQIAILTVVSAIEIALAAIVGFAMSASSILHGKFTEAGNIVKNTMGTIGGVIGNAQARTQKIFEASYDKMGKAAQGAANTQVNAQSEAAAKIQKQLERETESYQRELTKRNDMFQQQLDDLVRGHIEKKNSLMKDLAEENDDFRQKMAGRAKDFQESMDEMKKSHEEKVASIKQDQADENADFARSMQDQLDKYNETIDGMTDAHESKVEKLTRQMERERVAGDVMQSAKFLDLKQEIDDENKEFEKKKAKEDADNQKAVAKIQEANAKKLTDLQDQLTKEEEVYTASRTKAQIAEQQATELAKIEHDKRVANYQEQIDKENAILGKHTAEVAAIKDKVVEDDITRLQKQYETENAESLRNHEQKMKDLLEQGAKEGANYGSGILAGVDPKLKQFQDDMKKGAEEAGKNFVKSHEDAGKKAGEGLINNFFQAAANAAKAVAGATGKAVSKVANFVSEGLSDILKYFGAKQAGGIVPGPIGQPVPILAHGGETVTSAGITPKGVGSGGGSGAGVTFNVYLGLYAGTESERRNIAKKLYASLQELAQSQHKTVAEMMGG